MKVFIRLAAFTVLLTAGCTMGGPATGAATPNPAHSPASTVLATVVPSPGNPCGAANRCLALVTLRAGGVIVRDVTDIAHPTTVAQFTPPGGIRDAQFVSATEISFIEDVPQEEGDWVGLAPLSGTNRTVVAKSTRPIIAIAWSPDGKTLAYLTGSADYTELHLVTGGQDRVANTLPAIVGGCETASCADASELRLSYSPDGHFISLVQSFGGPNRIWSSEGKQVFTSDAGVAYRMSTWSGKSLYFARGDGIVAWQSGTVSPFLPGVSWLRPKGSPAGGQILFVSRDGSGQGHVNVVATASRSVRELKQARNQAVFLTARYVWYRGERACVASDQCDPGLPVVTTAQSYIYDLQDGTETGSVISQVFDVWPHAA